MNLQNVKLIIAREGLVIFIFVALFIVGLFTNISFLFTFPLWGYPLYLVTRFVYWSLRMLFPQYFLPWGKIESFTNNHRYKEALEFIEEYEKSHHDIKERFKDDKGWNLLKKTCFEGIFVTDYYERSNQLMQEKKYEEAKKIATEGSQLMMAFGDTLGISKEMVDNLYKKMKEHFHDIKNIKINDLANFRKEYIGTIASLNPGSHIQILFDLLLTPLLCDASTQKF